MEGKRFGAGLAAGLLLGLVIVTASSGFSFGLYGSFTSSPAGLASDTTVAKSTLSTTTQPISPASQNTSNSTANLSGRLTTNTTTGSPPLGATFASSTTPVFSSHVANIAQQPILTNAVIFLPILVAFLLGAVLYRASTKRRADVTAETK
ncbi:MAG: hypothetical protein OK452_09510 [Thaumarchaeota archaeon]|nr:hypothetical protein [Nitrososphaerota archaeon]